MAIELERPELMLGAYILPIDSDQELPRLEPNQVEDFLHLAQAEGLEPVAGIITINPRSMAVGSLVREISYTPSRINPIEAVAGPYIVRDTHTREPRLHDGLMIYHRYQDAVEF